MENPPIFSLYHLAELFYRYPYEPLFSNGILHVKGINLPSPKRGYIPCAMVYHIAYMDISENKPMMDAKLAFLSGTMA